jgi:large subunit ribosomal protein L4
VILADEEAAAGKSFRNLPSAEALPVEDAGVADIVGAASLLVSEAALQSLVARAGAAAEGASGSAGDEEEAA